MLDLGDAGLCADLDLAALLAGLLADGGPAAEGCLREHGRDPRRLLAELAVRSPVLAGHVAAALPLALVDDADLIARWLCAVPVAQYLTVKRLEDQGSTFDRVSETAAVAVAAAVPAAGALPVFDVDDTLAGLPLLDLAADVAPHTTTGRMFVRSVDLDGTGAGGCHHRGFGVITLHSGVTGAILDRYWAHELAHAIGDASGLDRGIVEPFAERLAPWLLEQHPATYDDVLPLARLAELGLRPLDWTAVGLPVGNDALLWFVLAPLRAAG